MSLLFEEFQSTTRTETCLSPAAVTKSWSGLKYRDFIILNIGNSPTYLVHERGDHQSPLRTKSTGGPIPGSRYWKLNLLKCSNIVKLITYISTSLSCVSMTVPELIVHRSDEATEATVMKRLKLLWWSDWSYCDEATAVYVYTEAYNVYVHMCIYVLQAAKQGGMVWPPNQPATLMCCRLQNRGGVLPIQPDTLLSVTGKSWRIYIHFNKTGLILVDKWQVTLVTLLKLCTDK